MERHAHGRGDDTHGRTMRTRTFLGLILLVAALIVASTPALLQPAATGVERLAVEAGVLDDQAKLAKERSARAEERGGSAADVEERLELKGFSVEEDGDLRDTKAVGEREVNERGRLEAGASRTLMPGQKPGTDAFSPPFAAEDGVLLDIDGCPVFRPEADVAALIANDEVLKLYQGKVAEADDVAACRAVFEERVAIATATEDDALRGAPGRQLAGLEYESLESLGITMREYEMLLAIFDFDDVPDVAGGAAEGGDEAGGAGTDAAAAPAADD
jgi:hypothetical protein